MRQISLSPEGTLEHDLRTVYKFPLPHVENTLLLPVSARPLHVGEQDGMVQLWVEVPVEPDRISDRTFMVYGTGHYQKTDVCHAYIGTAIIESNGNVWHVYETHAHSDEEIFAINIANAYLGGGQQ